MHPDKRRAGRRIRNTRRTSALIEARFSQIADASAEFVRAVDAITRQMAVFYAAPTIDALHPNTKETDT